MGEFQPQSLCHFAIIVVAIIYSFLARELAGPGYTTAPNQGAMVVFFLAAICWPVIGGTIFFAIHFILRLRGPLSFFIGAICWTISCTIPFLIGMK